MLRSTHSNHMRTCEVSFVSPFSMRHSDAFLPPAIESFTVVDHGSRRKDRAVIKEKLGGVPKTSKPDRSILPVIRQASNGNSLVHGCTPSSMAGPRLRKASARMHSDQSVVKTCCSRDSAPRSLRERWKHQVSTDFLQVGF